MKIVYCHLVLSYFFCKFYVSFFWIYYIYKKRSSFVQYKTCLVLATNPGYLDLVCIKLIKYNFSNFSFHAIKCTYPMVFACATPLSFTVRTGLLLLWYATFCFCIFAKKKQWF